MQRVAEHTMGQIIRLLLGIFFVNGLFCTPCEEDGLYLCQYQDHAQLITGLDLLAAEYPKYKIRGATSFCA